MPKLAYSLTNFSSMLWANLLPFRNLKILKSRAYFVILIIRRSFVDLKTPELPLSTDKSIIDVGALLIQSIKNQPLK